MSLELNFFTLFSLIAIGQGILLLVFLISKRWQNLSFRILFGILSVLLFTLLHDVLVETRLILYTPFLLSTGNFFSYCIGPLLLLYAYSITNRSFRFKGVYLLHFLPFVFYNIYKLPSYLNSTESKKTYLEWYYNMIDFNPLYFFEVRGLNDIVTGFLIFDLHKIIYLIFAILVYSSYRNKLLNKFSNIEKTNIHWLRNILIGYAIIWLMIPFERFYGFAGIDYSAMYYLGSILIAVQVFFISYMAFTQQESEIGKPTKSQESVPENVLEDILIQVQKLMREDQVYLNPDITLRSIAKQLEVREHNLSKSINEKLNQNFFDFVNQYRVEEAKRLLLETSMKAYTIDHIGQESGFTSKTTFYRAFKKFTGTTPSSYQSSN